MGREEGEVFQGPEDKVRWRAEGSEGCVQSSDILVLLVVLFFVWQHHTAHRISVPRLGIEPEPKAAQVRSSNNRTAREFLKEQVAKHVIK